MGKVLSCIGDYIEKLMLFHRKLQIITVHYSLLYLIGVLQTMINFQDYTQLGGHGDEAISLANLSSTNVYNILFIQKIITLSYHKFS